MANQRSGILWVLDSIVGHLAIAEREGYIGSLYNRHSLYFRRVDDAIASISSTGVPDAVLVGYVLTEDIDRLLREPTLQSVPKLIVDRSEESSQWRENESVYIATDEMSALSALQQFAKQVVDVTEPSWPR